MYKKESLVTSCLHSKFVNVIKSQLLILVGIKYQHSPPNIWLWLFLNLSVFFNFYIKCGMNICCYVHYICTTGLSFFLVYVEKCESLSDKCHVQILIFCV